MMCEWLELASDETMANRLHGPFMPMFYAGDVKVSGNTAQTAWIFDGTHRTLLVLADAMDGESLRILADALSGSLS